MRCTSRPEKRFGQSAGFTIVELMIATTVFSLVLLVLTAGMLQIGHVYYKGVTTGQTQAAVQTVVDSIQQDLQFSGGTFKQWTGGATSGVCIGNRLYQYRLQTMLSPSDPSVLSGVNLKNGGCADVSTVPVSGSMIEDQTELLGQRMRLVKLSVSPMPNDLYSITVRIVTGESDLLCSPTVYHDCNDPSDTYSHYPSPKPDDIQCKNVRSGTQYCATSEITAVAQRRV